MKLNDQELERLFADARSAPLDQASTEMPFGFATRVLSQAREGKEDLFSQVMPIIRWSVAASFALVIAAAAFSLYEPNGSSDLTQLAVQHQFTNLVLK